MLSEEQLQEYTESFTSKKEKFVKGVYIFPLDINFLNNKRCNWSFMNYSKILSKITTITEDIKKEKDPSLNDFTIAIIDEYVRMTNNLICLMNNAIKHYDNTFICEEDEIFEYLKELRIYDIVRKINCELLKKKLEEKLKVAFPSSFNQINIISGFSHGHSSLSARWKIPFTDDEKDGYFLIGPQIENNQFRTMIHICCNYFGISNSKNITDKQRKAIYEAVKEEVFSLGEDYYLANNEFNKYEGYHDKNQYISLYKYRKIGNKDIKFIKPDFDTLCNEFICSLDKFKNIKNTKEDLKLKIIENLKKCR